MQVTVPTRESNLPPYTIRPARESDSRFVYSLSMDPRVRAMSTRSEEFTFEEHERWYAEKLSNGLSAIWIMEVGVPVAQVRYGRTLPPFVESDCRMCMAALAMVGGHSHGPDGAVRYWTPAVKDSCCKFRGRLDAAEIAISVVPSYWRRGYALALLTETMPLAHEWLKVDTLVALVVRTNYASRRLFRRAGFEYVGVEVRMDRIHARYEVAQ